MEQLMDAIVKPTAGPGLTLRKVPVPVPGPGEVLIKVHKTAICGTDVHIYKWDEWSQKTIPVPMVVGHEYVGHIEKIGENIHHLKVGQRVSGEGHIVCGYCRNCRAGRRHLCPNTKGVGVNRPGAFAELLSLPAKNVVPVPDDIPDDIVSILDPLGNAAHTALSFNLVGEDVLITGAGPIGIMAVALAKAAGARYVVITDVNDTRLALARKMNPTLAVNTLHTSLPDVMKQLGMTEGFDVGCEMSGNIHALNGMLEVMACGGRIAQLGIPPGNAAIDMSKIIFKGLTMKGIYGREMFETWYKMMALIQAGMDVSPIITHHLRYDEFEKGFAAMLDGTAGKVILDWSCI